MLIFNIFEIEFEHRVLDKNVEIILRQTISLPHILSVSDVKVFGFPGLAIEKGAVQNWVPVLLDEALTVRVPVL